MTDKIWHDISEDSLEVRQSLIEKLNLSELQRRILIEPLAAASGRRRRLATD